MHPRTREAAASSSGRSPLAVHDCYGLKGSEFQGLPFVSIVVPFSGLTQGLRR